MNAPVAGILAGRVALVTGGGRGLGRQMALALAEAGASVAVTGARPSAALDRAFEEIAAIAGADRSFAAVADVADPAACRQLVAAVCERLGGLDVLVNNAGVGMRAVSETFNTEPTRFWETEPDIWRRIVDVNVNGAFFMARAAAAVMVARGAGKIVNISTSAATMVRRGYAPYGPSKAALEAATRIWAQDLAGTGVTVNAYLPGGAADTDFVPGGPGRTGADGQLLPAEIMRRGIVWLASAASDPVTGGHFVARQWDPALPDEAAARAARSMPADLPAIM